MTERPGIFDSLQKMNPTGEPSTKGQAQHEAQKGTVSEQPDRQTGTSSDQLGMSSFMNIMQAQQQTFLQTIQTLTQSRKRKSHEMSDEEDNEIENEFIESEPEQSEGAGASKDDDPFAQLETDNVVEEDDNDLLDFFGTQEAMGPDTTEKLSSAANKGFRSLANDKKLKDLAEAYPTPANCKGMKVPKVNQELWSQIRKYSRAREIKLQSIQESITRAAVPLIRLLENQLTPDVRTHAVAAFKLVANANAEMSMKRREMLVGELPQTYKHLGSPNNEVTEWLFGDDLPKKVKELQEAQKLSVSLGPQGYKKKPFTPNKTPYKGFGQNFKGKASANHKPKNWQRPPFQNKGWNNKGRQRETKEAQ